MVGKKFLVSSALVFGGVALTSIAQEELPTHLKEMLELGIHPGHTFVEEGKDYYNNLKGPNEKTCATCHGKDGEKLKGAYARMPKYYKDIDRVADADTRIRECMIKYMGFDGKDKKFNEDYTKKWRVPLVTFVSSLSNGMNIDVKLEHPKEKEMYKKGEELWYMRAGAREFACALCHNTFSGMRIRLQGLPNPVQGKLHAHWPAYRYGSDVMWTMEDRIRTCFDSYFLHLEKWDEKKDWVKSPPYYSDWVIALSLYMMHAANGAPVEVPGLLR